MRAGVSVLLSLAAIVGVSCVTQQNLAFSPSFPYHVMWIFGAGGTMVVVLAARHLHTRSFGPANHVTLIRAALLSLLIALAAEQPGSAAAWFAVVTASCILTLDGVDGWLARRRGEETAFGARFDMETDALLILAASWLVWKFGKAGPWILSAGLMRYMFVAASWIFEWMRRPLPVNQRRKRIFVAQAISLIVCLVPDISPALSNGVALAGLTLLTISFLLDVAWLARPAPPRRSPS